METFETKNMILVVALSIIGFEFSSHKLTSEGRFKFKYKFEHTTDKEEFIKWVDYYYTKKLLIHPNKTITQYRKLAKLLYNEKEIETL